MIHGSETWSIKEHEVELDKTEASMLTWMLGCKLKERKKECRETERESEREREREFYS